MNQNFVHCITTRFGVGIYDFEWYRYRFLLFEAITLPSLMAQTDQRFLWLIRIDPQIPQEAREHLETITGKFSNILILEWDEIYESLAPIKYMRQNLLSETIEHIITSRIDDDDAWRVNTVEILHELYDQHLPELRKYVESTEGGSFCNGLVITFPLGYEWVITEKEIRESVHPCHSMSVSVISNKASAINCFSTKHNKKQWMKYAKNNNLKYIELNENTPMWLYLRHKQANTAHSKFIRSQEKPITVSEKVVDSLEKNFGISRDNYRKYLDSHHNFTGFNKYLVSNSPSLWTEKKEIHKQIRKLTQDMKQCKLQEEREKIQAEIDLLGQKCIEKYTKLF